MPTDKEYHRASIEARRQNRAHGAWRLALLLTCVMASGASCPHVVQQYTQPIPRALPVSASLTQIIDVVNDNSARVQSLSTTRATITTPGAPSLSANIAFQRPRSFRLVAQKFGPEVDLGSNDAVLWFWIKRAQPPALFYCRHDQFATSSARQVIPVEPEWLIEALGVVTFDKTAPIDGPHAVGKGRVEIRTKATAPGGMSKLTIVDDTRGIVLEQHVYDAQGVRLATAVLSKHVHDPATGVTLPRHVDIQWPPTSFSLSIDMSEVLVNQLSGDPHELFAQPTYNGYNSIDLAQPSGQPVPSANGQFRAPPSARY
jgi:hypothetical protein